MSRLLDKVENELAKPVPIKDSEYIHVWVSKDTADSDRFVWEIALPKLLAVCRAAEACEKQTINSQLWWNVYLWLLKEVRKLDAVSGEGVSK